MFAHADPVPSVVTFDPNAVAHRLRAGDALDALSHAAQQLLDIDRGTSVSPRLHRVAACMHGIAAALEECESAGLERSTLLPHLEPLRELHGRSPFVRRLQTWPRGYPGDFETVEWLCDGANRAMPGTVAWAIEQFALQSPVAQQHRNKVSLQADAIRLVSAHPDARIASIGCGGCRDLRTLAGDLGGTRATFTLIDADAAALGFAEKALGPLSARCTFVHGRVPRVLSRVRVQAPFDLVIAGGLFDYLPDRWAVETLRQIRGLLAPGGRLVFSNIATGNPYRLWLVYLAEWFLIERSEAEIRRLVEGAGFDGSGVSLQRDATGLAWVVGVTSSL